MPNTNIFAAAKVVPSKKSTKKDKTPRVEVEGLETYSYICVVEKALKGLKDTFRGLIEPQMTDQFVIDGKALKRRPQNFKGHEGGATASCELRKRSTASPLSEVEVMMLDEAGIGYEPAVTKFQINPDYVNDQKLLQRVSDALSKVKDLPSDFIVAEQKGPTVTDDSLDQVFALPEKKMRQLLPVVGVLGVKPVMGELDLNVAMAKLTEVMGDEED